MKYLPSWFPGTQFKRIAEAARKDFDIAVDGPLEYVKEVLKVSLSEPLDRSPLITCLVG